MSSVEREKISGIIAVLQDAAEAVRRLEADARKALFSNDDADTYRQRLLDKTMLLMDLPETVEPYLDGLPRTVASEIKAGVNGFSRRAARALDVSSVFYMSALLYPDSYKDGDQNDLEKYVARLRSKYLS